MGGADDIDWLDGVASGRNADSWFCLGWLNRVTSLRDTDCWLCSSRFAACSKAVAKARTEAKRFSGFLASAVSTTCSISGERVGSCWQSEGGGVTLCLTPISVKEPLMGWSQLT